MRRRLWSILEAVFYVTHCPLLQGFLQLPFHSSRTCLVLGKGVTSDSRPCIVIYVTRNAVVATDVIALALTWIKTLSLWREGRRLRVPLSLSTCLLRDGELSASIMRVHLIPSP